MDQDLFFQDLPRIQFANDSGRLQEFLVNWIFSPSRPTAQQILWELEMLYPQCADWVAYNKLRVT